jgi:hypothetical protein
LDDPRNVDWSWAKPLLDKKYKVNQNGGGNNGAPTWGEVMSFVRDEVNRGRPDLGKGPKEELMTSVVGILPKLLEQQNSAQDPSKFIEAIATAVKLMSPPVAPVLEHKPDPMLAFVLDELKEGRKQHSADMLQMRTQHAEEMKEMRAQNAKLLESQTKPPDIMSQLDTISNIANKFSGIAGEPKKFWETAIEEGVPKLIDLFGAFVTMPRAPAVLRAPAPNAMQPGVGQPPRVNPQPAPPQPSPDQTSSVPPQQTAEPEPEMNIIQRSMLINIANLASAALNLSLPGDQFAEQMCLKFGDLNYEAFIGSVPKDNLIALFRQVPEAWVYLQPFEATLPEFIEHFYAFNEVEEEPQAAAAEPLKTKAKGKKK